MAVQGLAIESFQCRNHPDREGVGICVACRRVFCVECSTKIDGINHCRECLAKRATTAVEVSTAKSGIVGKLFSLFFALVTIAVSFLLVSGMFVVMAEEASRGGARRMGNRERLDSVGRGLQRFRRDTGKFPTDEEGLVALVSRPDETSGWHGPYVDVSFASLQHGRRVVVDAYGNEVLYRSPVNPQDLTCAIASGGADRSFESNLAAAKKLAVARAGEAEALGDDLILIVE